MTTKGQRQWQRQGPVESLGPLPIWVGRLAGWVECLRASCRGWVVCGAPPAACPMLRRGPVWWRWGMGWLGCLEPGWVAVYRRLRLWDWSCRAGRRVGLGTGLGLNPVQVAGRRILWLVTRWLWGWRSGWGRRSPQEPSPGPV